MLLIYIARFNSEKTKREVDCWKATLKLRKMKFAGFWIRRHFNKRFVHKSKSSAVFVCCRDLAELGELIKCHVNEVNYKQDTLLADLANIISNKTDLFDCR